MARVFRGEHTQKVDAKGRVSVPASFRRVLEAEDPDWSANKRPRLIVVYGDQRRKFLECYSMNAMADVDARIQLIPRGTPLRRVMETMFSSQSIELEVDDDGRIVLPQKLRDKIALDAEAYFAATSDTFQIWKPETYDAEERARQDDFVADLPEGVDILSLLPELPARAG